MINICRKIVFVTAAALCVTFEAAAATEITSGAQFATAVAADPDGSYVLKNDIDLTDSGFVTIDIFTGSIDGQGHKITGLGAKTFITTFQGSLKDITIDGTVNSANTVYAATPHGVVCDKSYGGKFIGVVVKGYTLKHKTGESIQPNGLFASMAYDGTEFTRCETAAGTEALYNSKSHVCIGGFVGKVGVTTPSGIIVSFVNCTNNATVVGSAGYNNTIGTGGFVGMTEEKGSSSIPDIQFLHCINRGNVSGAGKMNLGGFVGRMASSKKGGETFRCLIVDCLNEGMVTANGSAVPASTGGFIGSLASSATAVMRNCKNCGTVGAAGTNYAGGLVGDNAGDYGCSSILSQTFVNCANYGAITGAKVGGLVASSGVASWQAKGLYVYRNCANYGTLVGSTEAGGILGSQSGGAAGSSLDIDNCWIAAEPAYVSATKLVTFTNIHVNDADVSGLNTVAMDADGYAPWVLGATGKPELSMFTDATPATEVPVVFANWDGTILKKEFVSKGGNATPPPNPTREGFAFVGWSGTYTAVQQNAAVYAQFGANNFTITFDSAGGSACEPITAPMSSAISLPTPVRAGYSFVCWTENGARREPLTMPDYDLTLKAVWMHDDVPPSTKIKLLQWTIFGTNGAAAVFRSFVAGQLPDFVAVATNPTLTFPDGYDSVMRVTNGDNDGPRLYIAWQTNRFDKLAHALVSAASDNQELYAVVQERGTDNYYVIYDYRFSTSFTTLTTHSGSVASILDEVRAKYPTATMLIAGDHYVSPTMPDYTEVCDGTPAGFISYLNSRYGTRTVAGGDELELLLEKTAYLKLPLEVRSSDILENSEISVRKGRMTEFVLGKSGGLIVILR